MDEPANPPGATDHWLTSGVRDIGLASFLSDSGHEIPTSLLPSFLTVTLGAPASALGLIEGIADGAAGFAKLAGGALADDPGRRRRVAVGGYAVTAVLSSAVGLATTAWQVGVLRTGAWAARGIRGPSRNAILADVVHPSAYGRAYGFERAADNLGAIVGPLLALMLVSIVGVRRAILFSIVPGLLAALAMLFAARHVRKATTGERKPIKLQVRPVLRAGMTRLFVGMGAFEFGNCAATLLILRATELLQPAHGQDTAARIGVLLYVAYNAAAMLASIPAGHVGDRSGSRVTLVVGAGAFLAAYLLFAGVGAQDPRPRSGVRACRRGDRVRRDRGDGRRGGSRAGSGARFGVRVAGRDAERGQPAREHDRGGAVDGRVADGGVHVAGGMDGGGGGRIHDTADRWIATTTTTHRGGVASCS